MGSMLTRPSTKKKITIHIKKAVIRDNKIYLIGKDEMAEIFVDKIVNDKQNDSISVSL
jgi:hypothetical protein